MQTGETLAGFEIVGELGRGGMGVVYEAIQPGLGRHIALKVLDPRLAHEPEFVARLKSEGAAQASLSHPNVVTVYEAGEADGIVYVAMQLVRGTTLAAQLRSGSLDAATALALLEQVAAGLDAAHDAGLVHRDVKPHNVLIDGDGAAHLADFGITISREVAGLTAAGTVLGTVAYMAPEVITGKAATAESDRYSFAAMAFECLTGDTVFPRSSAAAVMYAHTTEPPPPVGTRRSELPTELDAVFARALDKEARGRPKRAQAVVESIRGALGAERIAKLGPPPPLSAQRQQATTAVPGEVEPLPTAATNRPRTGLLVACAAAALLVGGAVGALAFGGDGDTKTVRVAAPDPPAPVPAGEQPLGSALRQAGRITSVGCDGRAPSVTTPPCSIVPSVQVPRDGLITGWSVRGAKGDIQFQVLRERDGQTFQTAASQFEYASDTHPQHYDANLPVERGDRIGIVLASGSAAGIRPRAGAHLTRFFPPQRGFTAESKRSEDGPVTGELLLRADYKPNAEYVVPDQVTGPAARKLKAGKVVRRATLQYKNGGDVRLALVEVDGKVVVDLFNRKTRVARGDLPGLLPGGAAANFKAVNYDFEEANGEIDITWINANTGRIITRFYGVTPRALEFYS